MIELPKARLRMTGRIRGDKGPPAQPPKLVPPHRSQPTKITLAKRVTFLDEDEKDQNK
jgi:hypothetical protein